jgi:methionyl-tRNA formyltransferase
MTQRDLPASPPPFPRVRIVVDDPRSWNVGVAQQFIQRCEALGLAAPQLFHDYGEIPPGDILIMLGCVRIAPTTVLSLSRHNLVVHASALPHGRGFSPLSWQILEGKNVIPVSLIEAVADVDAGPIYEQTEVEFQGHELIDELREGIGAATIELLLRFLAKYPNVRSTEQSGPGTIYPRRRRIDSRLDINSSLLSQFNLLRIVDNSRYPAFFEHLGQRYRLTIERDTEENAAAPR